MTKLPNHVIRTSSPLRCSFIISLLSLSVLALSYYAWQQHKKLQQQAQQYGVIQQSQSDQQRQSQQQVEKIGSQQQLLSETTATARKKGQALAIQEATNEHLENQLTTLQDKLLDMEKKLSFYQASNPDNKTGGLKIHGFQLFSDNTKQPNQLRYRLILTQSQRIETALEGKATLQLPGEENSASIILTESPFKLRYVQVIEGYFVLEKGISPSEITVILSQEGKEKRRQSFDWQLHNIPIENNHDP